MIDVVFLLLIFFVWTSSFQKIEYLLPTNVQVSLGTTENANPPEVIPEELDFDQIVLSLSQTPDKKILWKFNEEPIPSLEALQRRLQMVASVKNDMLVILAPDREVPLGDAITVYDLSRSAGFQKVHFAAKDPQGPPQDEPIATGDS